MAHVVGESLGGARRQVDTIPVIGRDAELELLRAAIDAARLRQLQVVELVAEPGWASRGSFASCRRWHSASSSCRASVDPYAATRAVLDLARAAATARRHHARPVARRGGRAARPLGAGRDARPRARGCRCSRCRSTRTSSRRRRSRRSPERSRDRLQTSSSLLERVLMMPTLIIVEDAHWLDDASLLLLRQLVARPAARPWLVCVTARPAGGSILSAGRAGHAPRAAPLDVDAAAFALAVAQEHALSTDAVATLAARARAATRCSCASSSSRHGTARPRSCPRPSRRS